MAHWHEPAPRGGSVVYPARDDANVAVEFRGEDIRIAPFTTTFYRYEGPPPRPRRVTAWRDEPAGWFQLTPHEPLSASSQAEMEALVELWRPGLEDGSRDSLCERRPCVARQRPTPVETIAHPKRVAEAAIARRPDGVYMVRYRVYAPDGRYFPAETPCISQERGWEWGIARRETLTCADTLDDARAVATQELDEIVAADPEIRQRADG